MPKTLENIRNKVRRLTQKPSTAQITNDQIDTNIDDFLLYDFPVDLRLFSFTRNFTFYTQPYIDQYETNTTNANDPFYNFRNKYISVHPPVYVDGYETAFYQEQDYFYNHWRKTAYQQNVTTGDGGTTEFTGTLDSAPMLQNNVLFESLDSNNRGVILRDVPIVDGNGNPTNEGNLYTPGTEPAAPPTVKINTNTINYVTGVFTITFATAPASGEDITAHTIDYKESRPQAVLFFENKFKLRPVPDKPYKVDVQVYIRPTSLMNDGDVPYLEQMGEYIAYGAARKILQDETRYQDVQNIDPEFKRQEDLLRTRNLYQLSNRRARSEYDEVRLFGPWWPKYYR